MQRPLARPAVTPVRLYFSALLCKPLRWGSPVPAERLHQGQGYKGRAGTRAWGASPSRRRARTSGDAPAPPVVGGGHARAPDHPPPLPAVGSHVIDDHRLVSDDVVGLHVQAWLALPSRQAAGGTSVWSGTPRNALLPPQRAAQPTPARRGRLEGGPCGQASLPLDPLDGGRYRTPAREKALPPRAG